MTTWGEFAQTRPDLSAAGARLLYQYGVGLAFLATIRLDGGPRLHPVCPVLADGGLYLFVMASSPKRSDLLRDGRYALHTYQPPQEDEEFFCSGRATPVEDHARRMLVQAAAKHHVKDSEVLFELLLDRVLHTTWEHWATPDSRPQYTKWQAPAPAG
jgi:hypothetical protein